MSNMKFKGLLAGAAVGAIFALSGGQASAATLTFEKITSNTSLDASNQIDVSVVDDPGNDRALFTFTGLTGTLTSFAMAELYWDDSSALFDPPPTFVNSSDGTDGSEVSYTLGSGSPPNLPSQNNATPSFSSTASLIADADSSNSNAVGIGEFLTVGLNYNTGLDFANVVADLLDGDLRVGIHVRSHNGGGSESYVGGGCTGADCFPTADPPSAIPLPAGLPLILTALGVFGALRLRKRKTA